MNAPIRIFILSLILLGALSANAQRRYKGRNYKTRLSSGFKVNEALSIYGSTGFTNYYGDLCNDLSCLHLRPNLGVGVLYRLSSIVYSKSEINYIRMGSNDVWPDRNLSFRSGNLEIFSSLAFDLFKFTKNFRKRPKFSPYAFAGFGILFYNPHAKYDGHWYALRPLHTEGVKYGISTPIIPIGIGVKIKYSRNLDFLAEIGYRITFTDYLDDVSSYRFLKKSSFSNPVASNLSNRTTQGDSFQGYRGNPTKNDGYFVFSVKARYTFTQRHYLQNKYKEQHRKIY